MPINALGGIERPDRSEFNYTKATLDADSRRAIQRRDAARNALSRILSGSGGDFLSADMSGVTGVDPEYGIALMQAQNTAREKRDLNDAEIGLRGANSTKALQDAAASADKLGRAGFHDKLVSIGDLRSAALIDPERHKLYQENQKAQREYTLAGSKALVNMYAGAKTPEEWAVVTELGVSKGLLTEEDRGVYNSLYGHPEFLSSEMDNLKVEEEKLKAERESDLKIKEEAAKQDTMPAQAANDWNNSPTLQRLYPKVEDYIKAVSEFESSKAPKSSTNVYLPKQQDESNKYDLEVLKKGQEVYGNAQEQLRNDEDIINLVQAGATTGFGAEWRQRANKALKWAGIEEADARVMTTDQLMSVLSDGVLASAEKLTGPKSDADIKFLKEVRGSIGTDPLALVRMAERHKRMVTEGVELHNANVDRYNKSLSPGERPLVLGRIDIPGSSKKVFQERPKASDFKPGTVIMDKDSGMKLRSNGTKWEVED
jgi:hypothetical protein